MIVLLKLFLAHFIGDFLLQPEKWVKAKEAKKLGAWQLYTHSLLHGLLFLLLVWDISFWRWALLLSFVHFVIDSFKLLVQKNNTKRLLFFIMFLILINLMIVPKSLSLFNLSFETTEILSLFNFFWFTPFLGE